MELEVIVAYVFGLILLYFIARILLVPLKLIGRLLLNGVVGGILLFVFNLVGGYFSLYLPINPITAMVVGFLGIPGVVLLVALQQLLLRQGV